MSSDVNRGTPVRKDVGVHNVVRRAIGVPSGALDRLRRLLIDCGELADLPGVVAEATKRSLEGVASGSLLWDVPDSVLVFEGVRLGERRSKRPRTRPSF